MIILGIPLHPNNAAADPTLAVARFDRFDPGSHAP